VQLYKLWLFIDVCHSLGVFGFLCHIAMVSDASLFPPIPVMVDGEPKTGKTYNGKKKTKKT